MPPRDAAPKNGANSDQAATSLQHDPRLAAARAALTAELARQAKTPAQRRIARAVLADDTERAAWAMAYALDGWRVVPARPDDPKAPNVQRGTRPARWPSRPDAIARRALDAGGPRNWLGTAPDGAAVPDVDALEAARPFLAAMGLEDAPHVTTGRRDPSPGWHIAIANWPDGLPIALHVEAPDGRGPKFADVRRGGAAGVVLPGGIHPVTGETYMPPDDPSWTPGALLELTPAQLDTLRAWCERRMVARAAADGRAYQAAPVLPPSGIVDDRARGYVAGALAAACERIRAALEGDRNGTVNGEAFGVGRLADAGGLLRADALEALAAAGVAAGLTPPEAMRAARSGFDAGRRKPRGIPPPNDDGPPSGPRPGGRAPRPGDDASGPDGAAVDVGAFLEDWRNVMRELEAEQHHGARPSWGAHADAALELAARYGLALDVGVVGLGLAANRSRASARQWLRRASAAGVVAILDRGGFDRRTGRRTPLRFALTLPPGHDGAVRALGAHGGKSAGGGEREGGNLLNRSSNALTAERGGSAPLRGDARQHPSTRRGRGASAALDAAAPGQAAASCIGAGRADLLQALHDAGPNGATAAELAAAVAANGRPTMKLRSLNVALAVFVERGVASVEPGPPVPGRNGPRPRVFVAILEAAAALTGDVVGAAVRSKVRADAVEAAARLTMLAASPSPDMAARAAADAARPPVPPDVLEAADTARRGRQRCAAPRGPRRRHAGTIAPTPGELAAAELARQAANVPPVPAWLEGMGAGLDAADGGQPPAVGPWARTLDGGAILEAAAAVGGEPSEAAPRLAVAEPPAMPALAPPAARAHLDAAMREACEADAPPPSSAWRCLCGKASVGASCWGCGTPRERGERPALTVLPGGRQADDAEPDADALEDVARALLRQADAKRATARPALAIAPDGAP